MLVHDNPQYSKEFPERFPWGMVDSYLASELGGNLAREIREDLQTSDRLFTPGLRKALRELARQCVTLVDWEGKK